MSRRSTAIERRIRQALRTHSNADSTALAQLLVAKNAKSTTHNRFVQKAKSLGVK